MWAKQQLAMAIWRLCSPGWFWLLLTGQGLLSAADATLWIHNKLVASSAHLA